MKHVRLLAGVSILACGAIAAALLANNTTEKATSELATAVAAKDGSVVGDLLRGELKATGTRDVAVFAMPCFWSGEGYFGLQPGVYRTTPGMLGSDEVVAVEFDPREIALTKLVTEARAAGMAVHVYCRNDADLQTAKAVIGDDAIRSDAAVAIDETPKFYLQQSTLKSLPMTPAQAARVNAALHANQPIEPWLSPAQNVEAKRLLKLRSNAAACYDHGAMLQRVKQATPAGK